MLTPEEIRIIREYFLNKDHAQRKEFAASLQDRSAAKRLHILEMSFLKSPSRENYMFLFINIDGTGYSGEIEEIQDEFYQKTALSYLRNSHDEDANVMINAGNEKFLAILGEPVFSREVYTAFKLIERENLKKTFKKIETEIASISNNEKNEIKAAFRQIERNNLKEKFKNIERDEFEEKVPMRGFACRSIEIEHGEEENDVALVPVRKVSVRTIIFRLAGIAIAACLILVIWQPQKSSNETIFTQYLASSDQVIPPVNTIINESSSNGIRGEEQSIKNFTYLESQQVLDAVDLMKRRDFLNAKQIFINAGVSKDKSPEVLLYLAIAQLNTNDLGPAVKNLEYLSGLKNYRFSDDAKFHLALAYLKTNKNQQAKDLLNSLIDKKSRYSESAKQYLSKIRWF